MGGDLPVAERELSLAVQPPAVILLAGLQGAARRPRRQSSPSG